MMNNINLLQKVDWNVLNQHIDDNLIIANKHEEYDIWILNYSPKTQAKKVWNDYTLSCRGLVIDADGNVLARPFQKFKNYEEYDSSEIDMSQEFDAFEKMDGSLIILFYYEEQMKWIITSRGSFISEQAIEAKKMINVNIYDKLLKDHTYLFEIIYPENRIVVNYGDRRELVLLGTIRTDLGIEMYYDDMVSKYSRFFTIVKKLKLNTFNDLLEYKKSNRSNEEGAVVRFINGFRIKMKFEEYVRLHGILTNVSNLTVWEHMKNEYDFDELLDRVPDEFYDWLKRTTKKLQFEYNNIERLSLLEFVRIYHYNEIVDRKLFADEAKKSDYRAILFKLYDKSTYNKIIWQMIRPIFSKPFKDGYADDY